MTDLAALLRSTAVVLLLSVMGQAATSQSVIDRDAARGVISNDDAIVYRALAIVRPDALPSTYRTEEPNIEKCATDQIRQALGIIEGKPGSYSTAAGILATRPQTQFYFDTPGGHFRLHFDTSGTNAIPTADNDFNGIPDYIDRAAGIADSSWRYEVNQLGNLPPPSDGVNGGGLDLYDIYFQKISAYGFTSIDIPGPNPWNDYASFIVIHCSFAGFPPNHDPEGNVIGALKVTTAHEFYHAIQFAYNVSTASYFMEESSTWM